MREPKVAGNAPAVLELDAGSHWWCACGMSANQPFCDGTHGGSGFVPVEITLDAPQRVALCLCKRTATPPYCDGSHAKLG